MPTTRQFSVTLPTAMAEAVEAKIESGAYGSVSDMVRESVRVLLERDDAYDTWLNDDVIKSYDDHEADPSAAVPAEQVMARIRKRAAERKADLEG